MWNMPSSQTTNRNAHLNPNEATRYHNEKGANQRSYQRNNINHESGIDQEVPVHIRQRNNPTFESAMFTQTKFDNRSVRTNEESRVPSAMGDNSYYGNFYTEFANKEYKLNSGQKNKAIPKEEDMTSMSRVSLNHDQYAKHGYSKYEPKSDKKQSPTKIHAPDAYLGPNPRRQHQDVGFETPKDCQTTLICHNVNPEVNGKDVQRRLANMGYSVIDYKFKHDILTGERFGNGIMHVRAKTNNELNEICNAIEAIGMRVEVSDKFVPLWR